MLSVSRAGAALRSAAQAMRVRPARLSARNIHSSRGVAAGRWQKGGTPDDAEGEFDQAEFDEQVKAEFDEQVKEYKLFPEALVEEWRKDLPDPNSEVSPGTFKEGTSRRTGVIAKKMGMVSLWDHWGKQFHCTVVHVDNCQVVHTNSTENKFGEVQLQLGTGAAKPKNVNKAQLVHFKKAGVAPKLRLMSFPVSRDAVLPAGYTIDARHFVPGQFVDIRGTTIGKGFQGVMKKYNFKGQPASHGASLSHRSVGSIGNATFPGRVWKNKKMPGQMGNKKRTLQNVKVVKIDTKRNLIFLRGQVPGFKGNYVQIKDAHKRPFTGDDPPPFPTFIPDPNETDVPQYVEVPPPGEDPYLNELF